MDKYTVCGMLDHTGNGEWFPGFSFYFTRQYLERNAVVEYIERSGKFGDKYYVDFLDQTITLNANNLLIINQTNGKSILFSTFWNMQHLYKENQMLFDSSLVRCYSGHFNKHESAWLDKEYALQGKVSPWYFRPLFFKNSSAEHYSPDIEKLFFNGLYIRHSRDFIKTLQAYDVDYLDITVDDQHDTKLSMTDYYSHVCRYRVCLSAPGVRDMCNRDIEFFKMGIPFIRPRFSSTLLIDIPDDVYIPVECDIYGDRQWQLAGMPSDHNALAKAVNETYLQVRSNHKLLNETGRRAREFYNNHFTVDKIARHSYGLLQECEAFFS